MGVFEAKSVLVLGGSRGIGAAIVRRFVADGAKVTFTYSGSPDAAHALAAETGSTAVETDSADRDAVIARVKDSGALDVLVVNADNVVEQRKVTTGPLDEGLRVIESGLKADDRVVTAGLLRAIPGQKVDPQMQKGDATPAAAK